MPITILTGLPGSGKSTHLIEAVNAARSYGRPALTFACSDSPRLASRAYMHVDRVLGSRRPGLTCRLDHFVSTTECAALLEKVPEGTLVAFDEAYHFGKGIASEWSHASRRGLEVMIATPSNVQLDLLPPDDYTRLDFRITCERCQRADAITAIVLPTQDRTLALCTTCDHELAHAARQEILSRLERQPPYPGEKVTYQPVELEECANWRLLRPDSATRVKLMTEILRELRLPPSRSSSEHSYLDVGCNTGYFCHAMRRLGFFVEGVDLVEGDVAVARLLDTHFRRDQNIYVVADAYDYLHDTRHRRFDVTSAFAVFQWVMIQTSFERGVECMEMLFDKTRHVCFLEMGYSSEGQYRESLPAKLDQEWVRQLMTERGGFSEIRVYGAQEHGLMFGSRDLFVGIK